MGRARQGLAARMILASGLLALLVLGAFGVLLVALADEQDASELSRHSERVRVAARTLERLVIDLETGERGFLLTEETPPTPSRTTNRTAASAGRGSGLVGLRDRVEAIGGHLEVTSPPGGRISLLATIPHIRSMCATSAVITES